MKFKKYTLINVLREVVFQANRALRKEIGEEDISKPLEYSVLKKVFKMEEKMSPERSHEMWLESKKALGWKYGKELDWEKKEHPNFVPYRELPDSQKLKDYLFRGILEAFQKFDKEVLQTKGGK